MLEAERQFRRIVGYRHLADLVIAIERHALRSDTNHQLVTVTDTTATDTHTHPTEKAALTVTV